MFWSYSGRLQLFWDSPIIAGAVLASLLPWTAILIESGKKYGRFWFVFGGLLQTAICITCVLTQSRGALVAILVAVAVTAVIARLWQLPEFHFFRAAFVYIVVIAASAATDMRERLIVPAEGLDGSIENRFVIWAGSLKLMFDSPVSGLGAGNAGYFFSQWLQPESLNYRYTGVFNEFLQFGLEFGLLAGVLALVFAAAIVVTPFAVRWGQTDGRASGACTVLTASYGSLLAVLVCGQFSIIRHEPAIQCIAGMNLVAFVACVFLLGRRLQLRLSVTRLALGVTGLLGIAALVIGTAYASFPDPKVIISVPDRRVVELKKNVPEAEVRHAAVLVDQEYMGPLYGKVVRRWLDESASFTGFTVFDPRYELPEHALAGYKHVIMVGRACRLVRLLDDNFTGAITLIHPSASHLDVLLPKATFNVLFPTNSEDSALPDGFLGRPNVRLTSSGVAGRNLETAKLVLVPTDEI